MARSGSGRRESQRVRQDRVRTLGGSAARRLRAVLGAVAQRAGALVASRSGSVFTSGEGAEVASSRPTVATAEVVSNSGRAQAARFEIKVSQLAAAQANEGTSLSDTAQSAIQAGTNSFTISVGSRPAATVSVEISQGDSNRQALEKLEEAINDAGAGVSAELVSDSEAATSHLIVTASETGSDSVFSLADASGNAVSASGLGAIRTAAQDAEYVLNGSAFTSTSNTILADNGRIEITLKGASGPAGGAHEAAATIDVGPDPVPAAAAKLTDAFNRARSFLGETGSRGARSLLAGIDALSSDHASALAGVGVKRRADGYLTIDSSLLEASIGTRPDEVQTVLGSDAGFATELYTLAGQSLADLAADPAASSGNLVSYGFSLQKGFVGRNSAFSRGAQINFLA